MVSNAVEVLFIQFRLDGDANGHCLIIITQSLIVPYNIRKTRYSFPALGKINSDTD